MTTPTLALIGAGRIGATIADLLAATGDYRVRVLDHSAEALAALRTGPVRTPIDRVTVDVSDPAALRRALDGCWAVLSAAPFHLTTRVADAAAAAGAHYLDLTEDVASTRHVKALAQGASRAFIPQCGLAPGFVSIVAHDLAARFETLDSVRLRVGALPQYPSNALAYNLTWSTDGVINEYIAPCEAIVDGRLVQVPALEEREAFALDGVAYEAFNTSGGLGTLAETLAGRVRELNYRTIRYPGHAALMKTLLHDLRLRDRRALLKEILEGALPATAQDLVIVFVTVSGQRGGRLEQETWAHKVYAREVNGRMRTAIQVTTAAGICAVVDLLAEGALPQRGFVRQEDIGLDRFLSNRFGSVYAQVPPPALKRAA